MAMVERGRSRVTGVPTWSSTWNGACRDAGGRRGIPRGWYVAIGGASGGGKTRLSVRLIDGWLKAGENCLMVSMEPTFGQVVNLLYRANGWFSEYGQTVNARKLREARESFGWTGKLTVNQRITVTDPGLVLKYIRQQIKEQKIHRIVVDFVQMIGSDSPQMRDKAVAVARTINRLYELTRDYGVTVVVLSQLGRDGLKLQRRPMMSDLQWSSNIEHRADMVVLLDCARERHVPEAAEVRSYLLMAKNRHGPRIADIPFAVDLRRLRFREAQEDELGGWPE